MKLIRSKPRYRCDFCRRASTKEAMTRHEIICWKNPKRYCENCDNKGKTGNYDEGFEPCHYCSQRNDWSQDNRN